MPRLRSETGAPLSRARSNRPRAALPLPSARATRAMACGTAGALKAVAWGSTTVCTSACGRLKLPPSTWQSLWCKAMPTCPSTEPHSQAP